MDETLVTLIVTRRLASVAKAGENDRAGLESGLRVSLPNWAQPCLLQNQQLLYKFKFNNVLRLVIIEINVQDLLGLYSGSVSSHKAGVGPSWSGTIGRHPAHFPGRINRQHDTLLHSRKSSLLHQPTTIIFVLPQPPLTSLVIHNNYYAFPNLRSGLSSILNGLCQRKPADATLPRCLPSWCLRCQSSDCSSSLYHTLWSESFLPSYRRILW